MLRPCLEPGCRNLSVDSRCYLHAIPAYPSAERRRMAAAVAAHVQTYGWWCPGYGIRPHQSTDLTADHVLPRVRGGIGGRLAVLCRSCNGRKSAR